jgi:hypothetical protein
MAYYERTPDETVEFYRPNWSPSKNGRDVPQGHAWGRITCVPADYIPKRKRPQLHVPRNFWRSLLDEVLLRLEQTPRSQKLHIPFANVAIARRAYAAFRHHIFYQHLCVDMETAYHESPPALYVRRGPAWTKHAPSESERTATS